jgi:hypothetical protein
MTPENQHASLANMLRRHYTLITGVEPNQITNYFFIKTLKEAYGLSIN